MGARPRPKEELNMAVSQVPRYSEFTLNWESSSYAKASVLFVSIFNYSRKTHTNDAAGYPRDRGEHLTLSPLPLQCFEVSREVECVRSHSE